MPEHTSDATRDRKALTSVNTFVQRRGIVLDSAVVSWTITSGSFSLEPTTPDNI